MTSVSRTAFNRQIWEYYQKHGRDFPWRQSRDPYAILVSELMLQQTQTARVVPYFERWLEEFPTVQKLAEAEKKKVVELWQGLGYNRRALFLQRAAQKIVTSFGGEVPNNLADLITLPGVGVNTAGAVLAYAFNQPAIFVETNIRKTIIHFFFKGQEKVSDEEIRAKLEKVIDKEKPRQWYWAVVDYGSQLGKTKTVANNRSRHYVKQSQFIGSKRFTRSQILKFLLGAPRSRTEILENFADLPRADQALNELLNEGFCQVENEQITIR